MKYIAIRSLALGLPLLLATLGTAAAQSTERPDPPGLRALPLDRPDTAERGRMEFRRDSLQSRQRELDRQDSLGRADPLQQRERLELQGEIDRLRDRLGPSDRPR